MSNTDRNLLINTITSEDAKNILVNGKLYYPASNHYADNFKDPNLINVCCDFCNTSMLKISIGYNDKDICLSCADLIANNKKGIKSLAEAVGHFKPYNYYNMVKKGIKSLTEAVGHFKLYYNEYDDDAYTFMAQDSVRKRDYFAITKMAQDSVRK